MKKPFIIFLILIFNFHFSSAKDDLWKAFYDEKSELTGYKDKNNKIRIKPKFDAFGIARYFDKIIVVSEPADSLNNYQIYYLLKNGLKFGKDSIFNFDNSPDCESEGKIRFHDGKSDKIGFFDENANVTIPAIYNFASPFINNMALALIGAEKKCLDTKITDINNCEHWNWIRGRTVLLNDKNEILIDDMVYTEDVNWFSVNIIDSPGDTTINDYFKGKNGKFYSFLNYRKEFTNWFYNEFLKSDNLISYCFSEISFNHNNTKEKHYRNPKKFMNENRKLLLSKFVEIRNSKLEINIFKNDLPPKKIHEKQSLKYYDYCGNYKSWLYPIFNVVVTFNDDNGKFAYQDNYDFIRTEAGYKLFAVSLKNR